MIRKIIFLLLLFAGVVEIVAQTQKGIVRTAQRPNRKVEYLGGVTIRRSGDVNAVVSVAGGKFEILLPGKKVGEPFYLSRVAKPGYELADNGTIGKPFSYSPKVQVEIVMLNSKDKQDDIRRISDNAYRRAEKTYRQRTASLERQLKEKTLSEEECKKQLQELQIWYEKYENLIGVMAERYASTDYATIDSLNAAINICIENGELERADSLISTAGSLEQLVKESIEVKNNAHEKIRIGQEIMDKGVSQLAESKYNDTRLGNLLYSKYSICLARAENDSAKYYIAMRAELDTANVEWQTQAGRFITEYLAEYDQAMSYYQRALRNAKLQFGENSEWVATCLNNIGIIYNYQGEYDKALNLYVEALAIDKSVYGENHPNTAVSYNNIGYIYASQGNYAKALELYNKALEIDKSVYGENHPNVAAAYNNIGGIYQYQGDYSKALQLYLKALEIDKSVYGENHPNVAMSYNNIGGIYYNQGDYSKALELDFKALEIRMYVYGENHPDVARSYYNIGSIYSRQNKYVEALEMHTKALEIRKSVYGENHPDVAASYNDIGCIYYYQTDYAKALNMFEKALEIYKSVYVENHPYINSIIESIYESYIHLMQWSNEYDSQYWKFISEMVFTATVDGNVSAQNQGISGEYYLLEADGWNQDCTENIFDISNGQGSSKSLLLMKDGEIMPVNVDDISCINFGLKPVGAEQKQAITEAYRKWKAEH